MMGQPKYPLHQTQLWIKQVTVTKQHKFGGIGRLWMIELLGFQIHGYKSCYGALYHCLPYLLSVGFRSRFYILISFFLDWVLLLDLSIGLLMEVVWLSFGFRSFSIRIFAWFKNWGFSYSLDFSDCMDEYDESYDAWWSPRCDEDVFATFFLIHILNMKDLFLCFCFCFQNLWICFYFWNYMNEEDDETRKS